MGNELASLTFNWVIIPIGMLIGYYIVKAEPAIQVLNHQVENVTDGAVSVKAMNRCMSIGVAISVGLAMMRVLWDFLFSGSLFPAISSLWCCPVLCRKFLWVLPSTPAVWPAGP